MEKLNFKVISTKKEYMDLRLKLENSMLLFFAYDKKDTEHLEFLEELRNKFSKHVEFVLFNNESETKLLEVLLQENEKDVNLIDYPRVVLCHPHMTEAHVEVHIEPYRLYKMIQDYDKFYSVDFQKEKEKMFERIKKLLESSPVVIFIKGTPDDPFCKYSKSFMELMKNSGIKYKSFDIFKDESLRCWLRLYSGWKTYPQLYINGKIIGGVDKLKELMDKNEFLNLIPHECTREGTILFIEKYLKTHPVVVFGKGLPGMNKCKATEEMYSILKKFNIKFETFDILKDEMARELLKEFTGFKFYPMLFLHERLKGGLKWLKEVTEKHKIWEHVFILLNI